MTPDQKGSVAEAEIAAAAVRLGVGVLKPLNDGLRYDLIFDLRPKLLRVQCKWAACRGDVIIVNARTCRRSADGYIRGNYSADEVDAIGAYCLDVDRSYLIPISYVADRPSMRIRLAPTRNNQSRGINWAKDFEFAATLRRLVGP
jgi:PD-(D/E)XK endonuclease